MPNKNEFIKFTINAKNSQSGSKDAKKHKNSSSMLHSNNTNLFVNHNNNFKDMKKKIGKINGIYNSQINKRSSSLGRVHKY